MRLILALMILTGCGAETKSEIPDEFRPIVELYLSLAPNDGAIENITIITGPLGPESWGRCQMIEGVVLDKKVRIERRIIIADRLEPGPLRDAVLAHELAHCVHDFKHRDYGLMRPVSRSLTSEELVDAIKELWTRP